MVPKCKPARLNADYVMGPYGPVTLADLPPPDTIRWTMRRKAELVAAVCGGLLSLEDASRRYALNPQEFESWQFRFDHYAWRNCARPMLSFTKRPSKGCEV
jgi:hypothetical protein